MDSSLDSSLGTHALPADLAAWQCTPALIHAGFGCDPDVAVAALVTGPGGRFLALDAHGGGETALALASRGARAVHAVPLADPEAAAALLRLKVAAIRRLDRQAYLRFVGLLRSTRSERTLTYGLVRAYLTAPDRAFWDRHEDALVRGLFVQEADVAQGRLLRNLLRTHLPKAAYRELLYADRARRLAAFDQYVAGRKFWENALRMCAVRGQFRVCADGESSPLTCAEPVAALRRLVEAGPAACPVWVRAFANDTGVEAALPWHLSPLGYPALKANLDAVHVSVDAVAAMANEHAPLDAFELTRARAALSADAFARTLGAVVAHARPGARLLCTSADLQGLAVEDTLARDPDLETYVTGCDRAPGGNGRRVLRRL
jgi:S-adenosylmethionine:diacylglycerol 3-amino-3-carboxypropyl transferase